METFKNLGHFTNINIKAAAKLASASQLNWFFAFRHANFYV